MIKHTVKDNLIHISIAKTDFSYRIPLNGIANTIDWKIGAKETQGIVIKNVSSWALQLFTKNITEEKYVLQFKAIVKTLSPDSSINWKDTLLAITVQNQYNWLTSATAPTKKKLSEEETISNLKKKYKID